MKVAFTLVKFEKMENKLPMKTNITINKREIIKIILSNQNIFDYVNKKLKISLDGFLSSYLILSLKCLEKD